MTLSSRASAPTGPTSPIGDHDLPAVWVNGERQSSAGPHLSAYDRGFTLADGVFETMRVCSGNAVDLERHLARLLHALVALGIPHRPELRDWVLDAVRVVGRRDASIRLTVTRGPGPGGVAPVADRNPTVIVVANAPPVFPPAIYTLGLTAHVAAGRRNERGITTGLKTLAYTDAVVAMLEAQQAGADDALFLDTEGHCSEATSSNLFLWTGNMLVTPPVSCGALPGITRATVLDLARALGIPAVERACELDELLLAKEAFLTSSLRGIVPLVRVNARAIGPGVPGALTRQLADAYSAFVARQCAG